jgi:hypothetical protein
MSGVTRVGLGDSDLAAGVNQSDRQQIIEARRAVVMDISGGKALVEAIPPE